MDLKKSLWSMVYITIGGAAMMAVTYYLFVHNTHYRVLVDRIEFTYKVTDFDYKTKGEKGTRDFLVKQIYFTVDEAGKRDSRRLATGICRLMDDEFQIYRIMEVHVKLPSGAVLKYVYTRSDGLMTERKRKKVKPVDPLLLRIREGFRKNVPGARSAAYRAEPKENPKRIGLAYRTEDIGTIRDFDARQACVVASEVFPNAVEVMLEVTEIDSGETYRYTYPLPDGPLSNPTLVTNGKRPVGAEPRTP